MINYSTSQIVVIDIIVNLAVVFFRHNLRGRIVYHRYDGGELLRGFDRRFVEEDSLLNKIDYNPNANYINWLEDRLRSEFDYTCVHSLEDFNHINEKAVTKEGLIKSKGGKHEKDDRPEINRREHYVLGWDNREKIASLKNEYDELYDQLIDKRNELKHLDGQRKKLEELSDAFTLLLNFTPVRDKK